MLMIRIISPGLHVITSFQQEQENRYMTKSQTAAFFSGVTATMLQMTYQTNDRTVDVATNLLFLFALVLSMTSAVASLVAAGWYRSMV